MCSYLKSHHCRFHAQQRTKYARWGKKSTSTVCLLVLWIMGINSHSYAVEPQTSTPLYLPIHSQQYPELVQTLSAELIKSGLGNIELRTADYWSRYKQGIRKGQPGVFFAAPHFSAWAIHQHQFIPLLRLNQPLKFVIASRTTDSHYFEINDLNKQKVCTQNTLNLDYLLVIKAFNSSLQSANIEVMPSVIAQLEHTNSACAAFVMSDHHFIQQELQKPNTLIRLYQGQTFNNYAFIAHPSINEKTQTKIRAFLRQSKIQTLLRPMFAHTANNTTNLVTAKTEDYPLSYTSVLKPYWGEVK